MVTIGVGAGLLVLAVVVLLVFVGRVTDVARTEWTPWAWSVLNGWTANHAAVPPGPLLCMIDGPTAVAPGQPRRYAQSCAISPSTLGSADGSRHTNSGMGTPSSCCARGSCCR